MTKVPGWFTLVVCIALLWNIAGLLAVVADLRLTPADIAAMPKEQQALYAARPLWSVIASVVAVVGGAAGCLALLIRRKWALTLFYASLIGVIAQDVGIFFIAGQGKMGNPVPLILQGVVLLIAAGLILLARSAQAKAWIS